MKKVGFLILLVVAFSVDPTEAAKAIVPPESVLTIRELRYEGKVTDEEARFVVDVTAESTGKGEISDILFEGELALLPSKLPSALRIERSGAQYRLFVSKPGTYQFRLELVGKITRAEPWSQVSFKGPAAAIAAVVAQ